MYYYGARYYDPRFSIFVSVDPLAEQTMQPYLYVGNNPIMFTDPTGMEAENYDGPPPPKKGAKKDPFAEGSFNVARKYIGLGLSAAADPIGTVISIGKGVGQELNDFVGKDGAQLNKTLLRKGGEAFDSYVSRVSGSSDPGCEHQVILAEMVTEIAASALVTKGVSSLAGRIGTGSVVAEAPFTSSNINMPMGPLLKGSTGRTTAKNLMEEMAMDAVRRNPNLGTVIMENMKDSRWKGWSKMEYKVKSSEGVNGVIHYQGKWEKGVLKYVDDFKFKD